jgi:2',3'-cyclic-nucleotide 2'-phosphodiesterase (5'-nucleotidase family)
MKVFQILWIIGVGAGLLACSSASVFVQTDKVEVTTETSPDDSIQAFIAPYKEKLAANMNRVIGFATGDLLRDRPEGALGNFVIDETENFLQSEGWLKGKHYISIMNHGGLRSPISKGDITVGDVYKLMPFDNTIVLAKLPATEIDSIAAYLKNSGGEPIGGFTIDGDHTRFPEGLTLKDTLYVITTDYLVNGGDNMSFFNRIYEKTDTGIFLREALIKRVEIVDTIRPVLDNRIKW